MKIINDNFNLKQIATSGQCFRWKMINDNVCLVPAFGKVLFLKQNENEIILSCSQEEYDSIWKSYFDFDRDYSSIGRRIMNSHDEHLKEAYINGAGIRILKQDTWEIIISFMISQNNNIKRISKSIELICERVGLRPDNYSTNYDYLIEYGFDSSDIDFINSISKTFYRFPGAKEIDTSIFDDSNLGLGYRTPYIKEMCEFVSANPNWCIELMKLDFEEAFDTLVKCKGIGPKVSNCICLFGLGFVGAFPIDTHVKQLLDKYYSDGIDLSLFPGESGIIQQYLFYYEIK